MLKKMEILIAFTCKYFILSVKLKEFLSIYSYLNWNFYMFIKRHVQLNNDGAIEFYKKFGFTIVETKEHYYKRIEPADAYVLEKTLKSATNNEGDSKNIKSSIVS